MTAHPTAEWIARQITEAFPWDEAPDYMIRDRDGCYGHAVTKRLAAMGIRDHPIAPTVTLAEWACGETDRLDPPGMPRSHRRLRRGPPAPDPCGLHRLLQRMSERICPWVRMRRAIGLSNGSASSPLGRSSADFIMNTDEVERPRSPASKC